MWFLGKVVVVGMAIVCGFVVLIRVPCLRHRFYRSSSHFIISAERSQLCEPHKLHWLERVRYLIYIHFQDLWPYFL